jgi:hypothetical protein
MSHITQGGVVGRCWGFKKCSVLFELQINTINILNLNETRQKFLTSFMDDPLADSLSMVNILQY